MFGDTQVSAAQPLFQIISSTPCFQNSSARTSFASSSLSTVEDDDIDAAIMRTALG